ncbi:MAG: GNAT family N-acetyltransferase [Candidatus Bathyarchaeia archaeon]
MFNINRLEENWRDLVQIYPDTVELQGATVAHCLQTPVILFNHVTHFNITEDRSEIFLKTIINHFSSRKLPFACFRVSPLTPPSFTSLLEHHGFEKELEQSIMTFEGKPSNNSPQQNVTIKEIKEDSIDVFDRLMITNFEMPPEWKEIMDKLLVDFMRKGNRNYVAYADGQPVGTVSLFSKSRTGCILNVSTLKEYRNRGIGTELTNHALSDSFKEGNNLHTLQTHKGGDAEKLYRKIGFEVDHTVSFLVKKL